MVSNTHRPYALLPLPDMAQVAVCDPVVGRPVPKVPAPVEDVEAKNVVDPDVTQSCDPVDASTRALPGVLMSVTVAEAAFAFQETLESVEA